jgi:hypothetical protein
MAFVGKVSALVSRTTGHVESRLLGHRSRAEDYSLTESLVLP